MPDFGTPVAAGTNAPNLAQTTQNLSGLIGLKQQQQNLQLGAQQIQTGANTAQAAQQTMQERAGVTQMMKSGVDDQGNSIRGPDGTPDPAKILPALGRMAPLTGQQYAQSILATHNARIGVQSAATSLDSQQRGFLMGPIQSIAANPENPDAVQNASDALDQAVKAHPEMGGVVSFAKPLLAHIQAAQDPAKRAEMANSLSALLQPGQQVQTQPQNASVNNGQQTLLGTQAPANTGGAFTPATGVQQQPSPTTPVVDPKTGQPTMYGARPPMTATTAPVATGVAPGVAEGITGPVQTNNTHYAQVQADAAGAANRIAGLNNIRQELPNAWSGGGTAGDAARATLQNVYSLFGGANAETTAQDLIAKNLSQIASQGGATDAARTLTEMGNPGVHVTKDAAIEAVSQLMGVEAKKQAATAFFTGTPTNSPDYGNKVTMWNKYADPRAFQYANLPPAEQAAMKAKMKAAGTWASLNDSMSHLAALGVNP